MTHPLRVLAAPPTSPGPEEEAAALIAQCRAALMRRRDDEVLAGITDGLMTVAAALRENRATAEKQRKNEFLTDLMLDQEREIGWAEGYAARTAEEEEAARPAPGARHAAGGPRHLRALHGWAVPLILAGAVARRAWGVVTHRAVAASLAGVVAAGGGAAYVMSPAPPPAQATRHHPVTAAPAIPAVPAVPPVSPPGKRRRRPGHAVIVRVPGPGASPRASGRPGGPSPSDVPADGGGTAGVSPAMLALGLSRSGQLVITAEGGPVAWSVTTGPGVTADLPGGALAAGQAAVLVVSAAGAQGSGWVLIQPGNIRVPVTWAVPPPPVSPSPSPSPSGTG